jgi:hypothetical protein
MGLFNFGIEFAFEIGSGLLTEVRRLQSLLGERDKAIQGMKEEKDDLERTVESLQSALKAQEQSTGMRLVNMHVFNGNQLCIQKSTKKRTGIWKLLCKS